jgi:hypothetical protein
MTAISLDAEVNRQERPERHRVLDGGAVNARDTAWVVVGGATDVTNRTGSAAVAER